MEEQLKTYCDRWHEVATIERQELQSASVELRWKQLNAVIGLAIGLGIYQSSEENPEVFERWARLKEKEDNSLPLRI